MHTARVQLWYGNDILKTIIRLSHVSAPMSDYSCTTINSEMNRSIGGNEVSEDEEEDENAEPFQMPEESESQHESYSQDVRPDEFLNKNKGYVLQSILTNQSNDNIYL